MPRGTNPKENKIDEKYRLDYARRLRTTAALHVNIIYLWFNLIFLNSILVHFLPDIGQLPCPSASVLRYTASVLNPADSVLVSASSALVTILVMSMIYLN